jgi:hypothetical protein
MAGTERTGLIVEKLSSPRSQGDALADAAVNVLQSQRGAQQTLMLSRQSYTISVDSRHGLGSIEERGMRSSCNVFNVLRNFFSEASSLSR